MAAATPQSPKLNESRSISPPPYENLTQIGIATDTLHDTSQDQQVTQSSWQKGTDSRQSSSSMESDIELGQHGNDRGHRDSADMSFHGQEDAPIHRRSRSAGERFAFSQADGVAETEALGKQAFTRKVVTNGVLIALWYLFSVCISVYNKWMFAGEQLNFHFPLFTTSLHMAVQFVLSFLVLLVFPKLRPQFNPSAKDKLASSNPRQDEAFNSSKPSMTLRYYFTHVAPCGAATGLDIGLGNTSLRFVTLVFFTMCKSSTLGFVLVFAIIFQLEKASWRLAGIIVVMSAGVIMMVAGETKFSALGFALLMMASFFSGLRWSLTQILLKRNPTTSNPFSSLLFLTPVMFVVLLLTAIPVEGFRPLGDGLGELSAKKGGPMTALILLTPGVIAFLMVSSEFALLQRTSVVTLSVCGIFKEVITIAAGGVIFGDQLTPINISGLIVTVAAIAAYNYIRMSKMKREEMRKVQDSPEEEAPMLPSNEHTNGLVDEPGRTTSSRHVVRRSLGSTSEIPGSPLLQDSLGHGKARSSLAKLPEDVE